MMDTFSIQLTLLGCLLAGNILLGSIPPLLNKLIGHFSGSEDEWNRKVKVSTFLLYVGAGIFISNCFLVLLPLTNKEFVVSENHSHVQNENSAYGPSEKHPSENHHDSFPIPEFIVLCGFFLAYVVQELTYTLLTKCKRTSRVFIDKRVSYCTCAKRHTECSRTFKDARPDQTLFGLEKKLVESGCTPTSAGAEANADLEPEATVKSDLLRSSILAQAVPNYGTVTNATEPTVDNPLPGLTSPVLLANERRLAMETRDEMRYQNKFLINSMLIVIALTLQYIFQGMHLGLSAQFSKQWLYLLLICLQNFLLTFSASSYVTAGNMELSYTLLFIGILSTVSPLGLIVIIIEKNVVQDIPQLVKGIVSAIACGTLLYATFHEMLRQKNLGSVVGITKFLAVIMGASIMIFLQYGILIL